MKKKRWLRIEENSFIKVIDDKLQLKAVPIGRLYNCDFYYIKHVLALSMEWTPTEQLGNLSEHAPVKPA